MVNRTTEQLRNLLSFFLGFASNKLTTFLDYADNLS